MLVVSPLYFAGTIELGVITQSTGAFNHVLNDLSIIVNQFEGISSFSAGLNRLSTFVERMESFRGANATATFRLGGEDDDHGADDDVARVENSEVADGALRLEGLSLSTPDGQRELFRDVSARVAPWVPTWAPARLRRAEAPLFTGYASEASGASALQPLEPT